MYSHASGQDESRGKDTEGQVKPVFLLNNPNTLFSPSHPNYNHSMVCLAVIIKLFCWLCFKLIFLIPFQASVRYPYADAYFGGLFSTPYGQQAIVRSPDQ